jgi:hypothetical protein
VQGSVLAEPVATHLAGARPDLRDKARAEFIAAVDDMLASMPPEWQR